MKYISASDSLRPGQLNKMVSKLKDKAPPRKKELKMTDAQVWARKRNWLIRRLMGAKSIFSYDNSVFMEDTLKENGYAVQECEDTIDDLLKVLRKSTKD